ncbi:MAG: LamG domain-containing protein [Myxococcota bacterium]
MLLLALGACDGGKGDGPFALAFDGSPDCVEVAGDGGDVPVPLSVEAWIRGEPDPGELDMPIVTWTGVFDLREERGGTLAFAVGEGTVTYTQSVMDGVVHHLLGTFDGATATLFLDGERVGFADGAVADQTSELRLGCDGAGAGFKGVLDEVRVSSVARHTDDFERPTGRFEPDDDTFLLFHLDEGEGETTTDAASGWEGAIEGAEWISFEVPSS